MGDMKDQMCSPNTCALVWEGRPFKVSNVPLHPQIQSIRIHSTRCENKKSFIITSKDKTMKVSNNLIISLMGFISFSWRVPFPGSQLPSVGLRVKTLHTLVTDQVCQLTVAYLTFKGKVYWNVTGHKPSHKTSRWMGWNWFLPIIILVSFVSIADLVARPKPSINIKNKLRD